MRTYLLLIGISLMVLSCKKDKEIDDAILNLEVDVKVERFDRKQITRLCFLIGFRMNFGLID